MKPFLSFLIGVFIFSCQSPKEEARKPEEKKVQVKTLAPISEEVVAHSFGD